MSKLLYFSALAEHSAEQLTKSREQWTAFLTTVARLYKYPYGQWPDLKEVTKQMTTEQKAVERAKLPYDVFVADPKWVGVIETTPNLNRKEAMEKKAEVIRNGK